MRRPVAILVAILVGAVIWFFIQHYQLQQHSVDGTQTISIVPKDKQDSSSSDPSSTESPEKKTSPLSKFTFPRFTFGAKKEEEPADSENTVDTETIQEVTTHEVTTDSTYQRVTNRDPNTIRIASFHLTQFGTSATASEIAVNGVARVVRMFDVLALQGINPAGEASIVDVARKAGPQYVYLLSKTGTGDQRFAFIYNQDTIVADKGEGLYTLGDPDNLLQRDPLIGWFKAKRPAAEDAFTFTLVNIHTDRRRTLQELNLLDNVLHEVRQDWRNEDDVILLGCFQRPETELEELGKVRGIIPVIRGIGTALEEGYQTENMLFRGIETDEFTGRSGVFQFLRAYNLTLEDARQISEYLPVWAEFSIYEGGQRGRVATKTNSTSR